MRALVLALLLVVASSAFAAGSSGAALGLTAGKSDDAATRDSTPPLSSSKIVTVGMPSDNSR